MYKENFAERLRKTREKAGLTQLDISEETGISRSSISKIERGQIEPNLEALGAIAQYLNVSINWLLGVTIEPETKPSKPPKIWK